MNDEEKKAVEFLNFYKDMCMNRELSNLEHYETINDGEFIYKNLETVLNLIEKQQENYQSCMDYADSLNKDIGELLLKLEKQDKIINEMAEYINDTQLEVGRYYKNKQEVIEYFEKKVGKEE